MLFKLFDAAIHVGKADSVSMCPVDPVIRMVEFNPNIADQPATRHVFAGVAERAPEGWRKLGMEWLYRLLKEPKRIGRMAKLPLVLVDAAWARVRGR